MKPRRSGFGFPGGRVKKSLAQLGMTQLQDILEIKITPDTLKVIRLDKRSTRVTKEYPINWNREE